MSEGGKEKRRRDDFLPKSAEAVWGGKPPKVPFLTFRDRSRNGEMCLKKVVWLITPPPPYITGCTRIRTHTHAREQRSLPWKWLKWSCSDSRCGISAGKNAHFN